MTFDFHARRLDVLGQASDLEHGLLVAARRYDVRVRRLLDAFDGRAFGPDHQSDDAVGHAHLNGRLLARQDQIVDVQIRAAAAARAAVRRAARAILLLAS